VLPTSKKMKRHFGIIHTIEKGILAKKGGC
jgi:hypothetical protein